MLLMVDADFGWWRIFEETRSRFPLKFVAQDHSVRIIGNRFHARIKLQSNRPSMWIMCRVHDPIAFYHVRLFPMNFNLKCLKLTLVWNSISLTRSSFTISQNCRVGCVNSRQWSKEWNENQIMTANSLLLVRFNIKHIYEYEIHALVQC